MVVRVTRSICYRINKRDSVRNCSTHSSFPRDTRQMDQSFATICRSIDNVSHNTRSYLDFGFHVCTYPPRDILDYNKVGMPRVTLIGKFYFRSESGRSTFGGVIVETSHLRISGMNFIGIFPSYVGLQGAAEAGQSESAVTDVDQF